MLNGHIYQILQKVGGNVTFHSARLSAFPQPKPGKAESPRLMKHVAEKLKGYLGVTRVDFVQHTGILATTDSTLQRRIKETFGET